MAGSLGFASRLGGRGSVTAEQAAAQMYSNGIVSGFVVSPATPTANMTVKVGGVAGTPDVMVATNAVGNNVFLKNRNTDAFTLSMTAPASNSVIYSIVGFTDDLSVATSDATSVADNPSKCGVIAVSGTSAASPVAPSDAQIRTAITTAGFTGSQAAYGVLGYVTLTSATTTITAPNISQAGLAASLSVANLNGGTTAGVLNTDANGVVSVSEWKNYTPTLTGVSGGTLTVARYVKVGKTVFFKLHYTLAGAGVTGSITFTLPSTANETGNDYQKPIGTAAIVDAGTALYDGKTIFADNTYTKAAIRAINAAGSYSTLTNTSSTVPFTWGAGDFFSVEGCYEEA